MQSEDERDLAEFMRRWRPGASLDEVVPVPVDARAFRSMRRQRPEEPYAFALLREQAERELMGSSQHRQPGVPFFHYTTRGGLLGILEKGVIFGTEYQKLNDSTELWRGEDVIDAELQAITAEYSNDTIRGSVCRDVIALRQGRRVVDLPDVGIYVTSFSRDGDLVGQWDRYADSAQGFAIGFNSVPLPTGDPEPSRLDEELAVDFRACMYDVDAYQALIRQELFRIVGVFEKYVNTFPVTETQVLDLNHAAYVVGATRLGVLVPFLKHRGFAEEQEWRLLHIGVPPAKFSRITSYGDAECIEVPLRKPDLMDLHSVVVGPRAPEDAFDFARATLDRLGYSHVPVVRSDVPLR